jgi:4-carboxymuconolactone decarboxylase
MTSNASCQDIDVVTAVMLRRDGRPPGSTQQCGGNQWPGEIFGNQAGLAPEKVEALIAGLPTSFDDPRQQVIYDLTQALIGCRVIPTGLYRRSVDLLGDAGVTDLTTLIGYYTTVSLTLAAYNVPADAVGLKR